MKPYYDHAGIQIFHGDCREILPTFAPKSFDLVLTDPPYGHNNNNGDLISKWEAALGQLNAPQPMRPIANDGPEANELTRWMFGEAARLLSPGCCCCCCCCGGGGPDPQFARWSIWMDEAMNFKQMVVWDKGPIGMGWHYRRSYETVLVGEIPGAACRWFGDNKTENIIRPSPSIQKILPQKDDHPTPKPVALMAHFIRLHTENGQIVLDPFMGSGTTLVAAKQLGRRAVGIELEERYCEIAVKRLEQEYLPLATPAKEQQQEQTVFA